MNFGNETPFGFGSAGGGGGSGPGPLSNQFMWVVGGPSNFAGPPVAGDTVFTNAALAGRRVIVSRGGLNQLGLNPATGNTYYIKNTADDFLTFSSALVDQEEIIVNVF